MHIGLPNSNKMYTRHYQIRKRPLLLIGSIGLGAHLIVMRCERRNINRLIKIQYTIEPNTIFVLGENNVLVSKPDEGNCRMIGILHLYVVLLICTALP